MDGQEVYKFATRQVPACIKEALEKANLTVDDAGMVADDIFPIWSKFMGNFDKSAFRRFALNTAYAYLQTGLYKNALIVGSEVLSKLIDWTDRSTCVLFGDGAGAEYGLNSWGILTSLPSDALPQTQ